MKFGFGRRDITPRVGVELCGFGPFRNRHSIAVRDRLYARALAWEVDGEQAVLVSCDLIGVSADITERVRARVRQASGLSADRVMVHCTHTHSGPGTGAYIGWGDPDLPFLELLPARIAGACSEALKNLREATLSHAEVPCEGIGLNREYDAFRAELDDILDENWRPQKPECTDTTAHVFTVSSGDRVLGFVSYFGCHPVVCAANTRYIHGDYCGVATNMLEREVPGSVGLFLQGAQGDVNSCIVAREEPEALRALDIIASRYARAVRRGIRRAAPVAVDGVQSARRRIPFSRKPWNRARLCDMLAAEESLTRSPNADDGDHQMRLATVRAVALRRMISALDRGETLTPELELQGLRLGPVAFLGTPFEVQRAIKTDVVQAAKAPIPLVLGLTNNSAGYAVDRRVAERGGYAADLVPLIQAALPFAAIHDELRDALLRIDADLHS